MLYLDFIKLHFPPTKTSTFHTFRATTAKPTPPNPSSSKHPVSSKPPIQLHPPNTTSTSVPTVAKGTARPVIWQGTDRHTGVLLIKKRDDVPIATSFTWACRHFRCTCGRTIRAASVSTAESVSLDRGCCKDTSGRIQVRCFQKNKECFVWVQQFCISHHLHFLEKLIDTKGCFSKLLQSMGARIQMVNP